MAVYHGFVVFITVLLVLITVWLVFITVLLVFIMGLLVFITVLLVFITSFLCSSLFYCSSSRLVWCSPRFVGVYHGFVGVHHGFIHVHHGFVRVHRCFVGIHYGLCLHCCVCKINVTLYLLIKLLLGKSYRYTNYTVVITIWLAVTKYSYLKWQWVVSFLRRFFSFLYHCQDFKRTWLNMNKPTTVI